MDQPQHYIASQSSRWLESQAIVPAGHTQTSAQLVPVGTCHAMAPDDEHTACGVPAGGLEHFQETPWGQGIRSCWCPECVELVPF